MATSEIAFREDYEFAQSLLSGESEAWDRFYNEFRSRLQAFINRKYPNVFSEIAIEEIFDGVGRRLIENDYKAIRDYRGECSFSAYVTRATEWEIRDWLRRHSEELMNEPLDPIGNDGIAERREFENPPPLIEEDYQIPDILKSLSDDLRWAFLFRYYDYFGFPFDEIRRLAKKKNVSIASVIEKIIKYLEPDGNDLLKTQREKQRLLHARIERVCGKIHDLTIKEHRVLLEKEQTHEAYSPEDLHSIRNERTRLEAKREALSKEKKKFAVTTPYEVIAEILGEDNVSTIRSRVFLAKKQLAQTIAKESKTFHGSISS